MKFKQDIEVLRQHVEQLGLDQASSIKRIDLVNLADSLAESDEFSLCRYVKDLAEPSELADLIVNTLYG